MKMIELTIHTTTEASELVADVLWNYTTFGVAIADRNDLVALRENKDSLYWDYMDDDVLTSMGTEALVKCYLEPSAALTDIPAIIEEIAKTKERSEGLIPFGSLETTKREVEGDEWIDIWKKHFRPIPLGKIVIVPEWIEYSPKEGEHVVLLDSNMAFGTGEHETTSLCIELMQDYLTPDSVCIDVGCGSGILGISAVKLGAKRAYLTDIDQIAVSSATHNSILNRTDDKTVVAHSNLLDNTEVKGDIMLANITGEILCMLAPSIPKNLKEDGVLILSGIIDSRLAMVENAYAAVGMKVVRREQKGEWFALVLKHEEK
ncbi:MAG: 50S ribosomal protein L11 methyltransferase [Clostridia bacterium]|nr:50S ribosomal protein L11 methyltransferase [Clostridia bacterium]